MALQVDMKETAVGLPAPHAYARIVAISKDYVSGKLQVTVHVSAHAQARKEAKAPVSAGTFELGPEPGAPDLDDAGHGLRGTCYAWLKTLPAFAGATDV